MGTQESANGIGKKCSKASRFGESVKKLSVFPRERRFAARCNCVSRFQPAAYRKYLSYTWKPEMGNMLSTMHSSHQETPVSPKGGITLQGVERDSTQSNLEDLPVSASSHPDFPTHTLSLRVEEAPMLTLPPPIPAAGTPSLPKFLILPSSTSSRLLEYPEEMHLEEGTTSLRDYMAQLYPPSDQKIRAALDSGTSQASSPTPALDTPLDPETTSTLGDIPTWDIWRIPMDDAEFWGAYHFGEMEEVSNLLRKRELQRQAKETSATAATNAKKRGRPERWLS